MFSYLAVEGEISNFKHHTSGHMYFTLKDERSRIKAVMFRSRNAGLNFKPKDGDTVIVVGSIGVYEPNGEYQIYLEQMLPQGVGALHIKFEELKKAGGGRVICSGAEEASAILTASNRNNYISYRSRCARLYKRDPQALSFDGYSDYSGYSSR